MEAQLTRTGDLTASQRKVIDAPPSARLLVTAGPGTGKTYVLIRRLARLVTEEGLNPAQEVLALSFSRSAVKNIRDRVVDMAPSVRYARVATFDSFASRLLHSEDPDGSWTTGGYDDRIEAGTKLIRHRDDLEELADIQQILIDEVQDLVGPRRALVEALLERTDAPFSIFGDPAQGIYNFNLPSGPERDSGSALFYQWLRGQYTGLLEEVELDVTFRAQTSDSRIALWAGAELGRTDSDCEMVWKRFSVDIGKLPSLGTVEVAARSLGRSQHSTALLCRDNGQALVASRALHQKEISHTLQRRATDRAVAEWVARSLWGMAGTTVSRSSFGVHWANSLLDGDADEAWRSLKRTERRPGDKQLDLRILNCAISNGVVDEALLHQGESNLTVSSMHRAKGLEFHTVGIVQPKEPLDDVSRCEEARLLYVALTRPSHVLMHVGGPDTKGMSSKMNPDERWVRRRPFGGGAFMTLDIEVRGADIDSTVPFTHAKGLPQLLPEQMLILFESIRPGDPVELWLDDTLPSGFVRYILKHDVGAIGVSSAGFNSSLRRAIAISRTHGMPRRIDKLWIEFVDTVAGDPSVTRSSGIGESGLWLRARAYGLGHLIWK